MGAEVGWLAPIELDAGQACVWRRVLLRCVALPVTACELGMACLCDNSPLENQRDMPFRLGFFPCLWEGS